MRAGWEIKKLGDVCEIIGGGTPAKNLEEYYNGELLWTTVGDMQGDYVFDTKFKITLLGLKNSASNIIPKNHVIIATRVGLGKVCLLKNDSAINQDLKGIIPKKNFNISNRFLFWWFKSISQQIIDEGTGATVQGVKLPFINSLLFPLLPLPEQQRIVSILDEAFAVIDQAKANVQRNLQNAKELFQSELNSIFTNQGEGWESKDFGDLIVTLTDYHANGSYEALKANVELKETPDYAWMVRSTDFENNFKNNFRYIDKKGYEFLKKSKVFGGEIIISKIGNAGKVYLMPIPNKPCSLAMNLFLLRINKEVALPQFIYYYLISNNGEAQIKSRLNGMATKTITKDNVRNIIIPIPSLNEQQKIIAQLNTLSIQSQKLEKLYQHKLNELEALKKSILQKAFSGELKSIDTEVAV